jgi:hypothetical protein
MSPESRDLSYLWDMLNAAHKISERIAGKKFFDFRQDETLQLAIERLLEIIGEALFPRSGFPFTKKLLLNSPEKSKSSLFHLFSSFN